MMVMASRQIGESRPRHSHRQWIRAHSGGLNDRSLRSGESISTAGKSIKRWWKTSLVEGESADSCDAETCCCYKGLETSVGTWAGELCVLGLVAGACTVRNPGNRRRDDDGAIEG